MLRNFVIGASSAALFGALAIGAATPSMADDYNGYGTTYGYRQPHHCHHYRTTADEDYRYRGHRDTADDDYGYRRYQSYRWETRRYDDEDGARYVAVAPRTYWRQSQSTYWAPRPPADIPYGDDASW
jgi:hypothetical protein